MARSSSSSAGFDKSPMAHRRAQLAPPQLLTLLAVHRLSLRCTTSKTPRCFGPQAPHLLARFPSPHLAHPPGAYPVFSSALVQTATYLQKVKPRLHSLSQHALSLHHCAEASHCSVPQALAALPEKTNFNLAMGHKWNYQEEVDEEWKQSLEVGVASLA
jgi:hypothetical protein